MFKGLATSLAIITGLMVGAPWAIIALME